MVCHFLLQGIFLTQGLNPVSHTVGRCCTTWVGKIPWRREWQPTPVFLPGESHGWRSLAGYSPWGLVTKTTTTTTTKTYLEPCPWVLGLASLTLPCTTLPASSPAWAAALQAHPSERAILASLLPMLPHHILPFIYSSLLAFFFSIAHSAIGHLMCFIVYLSPPTRT